MGRVRPTARRVANQFALSDELFRYAVTPIQGQHPQHDQRHEVHAGGADQPLFAYVNLMGAHLPHYSESQKREL